MSSMDWILSSGFFCGFSFNFHLNFFFLNLILKNKYKNSCIVIIVFVSLSFCLFMQTFPNL